MSALLVRWLDAVITRPVAALRHRIDEISEGNFTIDHTIEWSNELGDIGRGINHLAGNVEGLLARRLEDQKRKQDLEYQMLQTEINPHFIYNTLNSIRWMATIQNATGIAEMVTAFRDGHGLCPADQEHLQEHRKAGTPPGRAGFAERLLYHPAVPLRRRHPDRGGPHRRRGHLPGLHDPALHPAASGGERHFSRAGTQGRLWQRPAGDTHQPRRRGRAGHHDRRRGGDAGWSP